MCLLKEVMKILRGKYGVIKAAITDHCARYRHTSIGKKHRESSKRDMRFLQSEKGLAFLRGAEHLFTETWQQNQTDVSP